MKFEVLEYNDADETVLVAVGAAKSDRDTQSTGRTRLSRRGRPRWCWPVPPTGPGSATWWSPDASCSTSPIGHFDTMLHLFTSQAKMAAYEELAMFRSIFPEQWVQSHPNAPTKSQDHPGRRRQAGHRSASSRTGSSRPS